MSLPGGMSVCQQKKRTTPHPPPRQPARPAPGFLSKLGSHRAPLPEPRLGRGPHAAPAKLQLPLVLGLSHPRPLNWGFRARTAMSLGSAGSRTRHISSPPLWYLSLGAMDTSSRKPSRRPLELPGRPVACCQPAEREVILASGYRAGTGGAWLGLGALNACRWGGGLASPTQVPRSRHGTRRPSSGTRRDQAPPQARGESLTLPVWLGDGEKLNFSGGTKSSGGRWGCVCDREKRLSERPQRSLP